MAVRTRLSDPFASLAGVLLASLAVLTALAYPLVPRTMRVHWSLGGPYTGPETLPKLLGLGAIPLTALAVVGLLLALPRAGLVPREVADSRVYRLAVAGTVALLGLCQLLLVGLNVAL
jgi:uncharacterized membrane protein